MNVIPRYYSDAIAFIEPPSDPRTNDFITRNCSFTLLIMGLYYYSARFLGPKLMKNREPIDCKAAMIIYNCMQIGWNTISVIVTAKYYFLPRRFDFLCSEVLPPGDYNGDMLARLAITYYLNKLFDLVDTVFMILRKKNKQISPLHVNHHTMMIFASWFGLKFAPGGFSSFFVTINAFVHIIMYGYYLLTILSPQYKDSIWWKRHITELQMAQFAAIGTIGMVHFLNPFCNFPKIALLLMFPNHFYITYTFWDFYKKNYLHKNGHKKE